MTQCPLLKATQLFWPKLQLSAFLLTLFTHWTSQFLHSRVPQASLFTSMFKVWEPASIQALSLTRALLGPCIRKTLPPGWGLRSTRDNCSSSTHPPRIIFLGLPPLSPTLRGQKPCEFFSDFLRLNLSPKCTQEGRAFDTELLGSAAASLWSSGQNCLQSLGSPSGQNWPNTEIWHFSLFLLGPPHNLFMEEVFCPSERQIAPIHCDWLDT